MKQVLTKEEVEKVMREMASQGRKTTLNSLHAALNHRGSMTTLMRLKTEIESAAQPTHDSVEGLKAFREVWALAVDEGRKQQEEVIARLKEDQQALVAENERLDGKATAAENQLKELEAAKQAAEAELVAVRNRLEQELKKAQAALVQATDQARESLAKLAAAQAAHSEELSALRKKLDTESEKAHKLELDLVHSKALLEAQGAKRAKT